jgi:hypothetical protein
MAREPSGDYNRIMACGSSVFREIGIASMILWLTAAGAGCDGAQAKQCSNPCEVSDGDICASVRLIGELGRPLAMHPGRQSGTCGGVKPLPADQLVLTWSRDPAGPFTPIPVQRRGDDVLITPDSAGAYYIEAAARDGAGAPDRAVVLVVDPKTEPVRLRLRPDKRLAASATSVKVRWVPPAGADRFPRRRWPVWLDNDRAGMAGQPLRLPTGRYDVEWTHVARGKTQTGVTTIEVTGAGSVDVPLTVASASPGSVSPGSVSPGSASPQALSSAKPGCSTAKSPER